MSKSLLHIGMMLVGTALVTACNASGPSLKEDTAATAAHPPAVRASAVSDTPKVLKMAAWPNVDIVLLKDYAAARGPAAFMLRIHMDVELVRTPPTELGTVEGHLNGQNGTGVLNAIMRDLETTGTRASWRTLKAGLRCNDATLVLQDARCTRRPPVSTTGSWPIPDIITMKDWEGAQAAPAHAVRVHMDIELQNGQTSFDAIDRVLAQGQPELVLGHLVTDGAIQANVGDPAGWATLKAALGCNQFDRDPAHC